MFCLMMVLETGQAYQTLFKKHKVKGHQLHDYTLSEIYNLLL